MICFIFFVLFFITKRLLHRTVNILRQFIDDDDQTPQHSSSSRPPPRVEESTDEEIQKDPLIVLRCDRRVFRCPPLFDIMLRVLRGYMTASRGLLNHHILSNPLSGSKILTVFFFFFLQWNLSKANSSIRRTVVLGKEKRKGCYLFS